MTICRECPVCKGSGRWKRQYFDAQEEPCKNCGSSGKIQVEVNVTRQYLCDTCRTPFESDFTLEPEKLGDLSRCCPQCNNAGFLRLETVADIVRVLSVLEERP